MPRKKLIRRFEPRYSVSQEMLDREAQYVVREHEDHLLGSIEGLRERLEQLQMLWHQVNEGAEYLILLQGEREALAYRCMIARDLYHILELYCTCMRAGLPEASADTPPAPRKPVEEENRIMPFSEWLFIGTE
jgi:hypothetical protein